MRNQFFIIRNPKAGLAARQFFDATVAALKASGASIEVLETSRYGDGKGAAARAAESGRFDAVLAAGGDGTVNDVADGLVGLPTPLGIIPLGTANVLAREIGLPRSPGELARSLSEGAVREIAIGRANGRPFLFVVGVGFDAAAVRIFEQESTRRLGQAGYAWPILRAVFSHKDRPLRIETAHGITEAHWVLVTRTKHYAGSRVLAPDADLKQPHFHVVYVFGDNPWTRIRQLAALGLNRLSRDPEVRIEVTDRVSIEGDRTTPVQIDGEALGELPLDIRIDPQRLRVIFPAPPDMRG